MDTTTAENEITIDSAPAQNGYSNGISNGNIAEESHVTETVKETKATLVTCPTIVPSAVSYNGSMLKKDVYYPYQKVQYMSPGYNLSFDSKRMIRRLQEPVIAASPGTVQLVYEVRQLKKKYPWNLLLNYLLALSLCLFSMSLSLSSALLCLFTILRFQGFNKIIMN